MDYKITQLSRQIEIKDALIEDFQDLLFGTTPEGDAVFDATEYCERNKELGAFNVRVFMRVCKPFIEKFIQAESVRPGNMFFQNADGHSLIIADFSFLFLSFVDDSLFMYFNDLITTIIHEGLAYSDSFLLQQTAQRIPSEVLEKIIDLRKEKENEQKTTGE